MNTEDDELWKEITKKDKKYSKSNRVVFSNTRKIRSKPSYDNKKNNFINFKKEDNDEKEIKTIVKEKYIREINLEPNVIPSGISLKQAENLKKGKIRPEVKIDLHGFTQEKANLYLKDKLTEFYKKNIRCVLVITGKKLGKHGSEGVLKREVPKWLNISPIRQMILMTSWAQPKDGGDGALYVLLKKGSKF